MSQPLAVLTWSLNFYGRHLLPLLGLTFFAAGGRVMQLGWSNQITSATHWGLEVMVEGVRLLLLIFIARMTATELPLSAKQFFVMLLPNFSKRWVAVLLSILVFSSFAYLVNSGISWLAEQNSLLNLIQQLPYLGELDKDRLPMLVVFFLKNLTIIPFTLVWVCYGLVRLLH